MRLTTFILMIGLVQASAAGYAQKISLKEQNVSLEKVLKSIEQKSDYVFFYDSKDLPATKVSVNISDASIEEAIQASVKDLPLSWEIVKNNIFLKRKVPTFLERLANRWASIDAFGRVVDAEGKPLPGATVKVKATGKGVSTDVKGNFHLRNVEEGAVLVVSYTGYISKEVKAEKDMGNVVLEQSLSKLDEVQVIAYGTTTQRLSTGNVTTIKADVIEKQPVNNPLLALQGRVPGLFIEQATGFAGTGVKVRIQGQNSKNYGSDPLYIIDGVPYPSASMPGGNSILGTSGGKDNGFISVGNPLNLINPSDIESIDILKDADATAIYGSRAANGAILITTKKGKAGDTRISFNLQNGWGDVAHKLDLMNSKEFIEMRKEALKNDGILNPTANPYGDSDLNGHWDNTRNTDWQEELIGGTAKYNDINASVSGGNELTTFLIGAGYHRETTVFPSAHSGQKGSLHFNINNTSKNQRFKIQFSGSYLYDNNKLPTEDLTAQAITLSPVAPELYTPEGAINWASDEYGATSFINPIGFLSNYFVNKTNNLIANINLKYQILPGLEFGSSLGYNTLSSDNTGKQFLESVYPENKPYATRSTIFGNNKSNSWIIEPQLTYYRNIDKGRLEVLLGGTLLQTKMNGSTILTYGFSNDLVMDDIVSAPNIVPGGSFSSVSKNNALFGRLNYNWVDRYILNFTGRRDGSSKFGPKNQFHNFASAGAAWIFSNEMFIKNNVKFLSFGKLRGSYGTTGSDQIPDYLFLSLYTPVSVEIPYQGVPVYVPSGLTNPYLQWEETRKTQFGLDLGFLDNLFLLNINYYINHSSNQLQNYPLPTTTGPSNVTRNQAYKIRNSGWELMLTSTKKLSDNFTWSSSINLTVPKTLLVDFPDIAKSSLASSLFVGSPLTSQALFHFLGVNPATGAYQFADINGNPTSAPTIEDKSIIVDMAPKYYGGLQNSINFKGIEFSFLFSFVKQLGTKYSFGNSNILPGVSEFGNGNQPKSLLARWQKPGDISEIQKFTITNTELKTALAKVYESDAGVQDASYIRLKNASLAWNLPGRWMKNIRLNSLNLFVQGQNLWTITRYSGLDPENKSSIALPPLRVLVFGVKTTL